MQLLWGSFTKITWRSITILPVAARFHWEGTVLGGGEDEIFITLVLSPKCLELIPEGANLCILGDK